MAQRHQTQVRVDRAVKIGHDQLGGDPYHLCQSRDLDDPCHNLRAAARLEPHKLVVLCLLLFLLLHKHQRHYPVFGAEVEAELDLDLGELSRKTNWRARISRTYCRGPFHALCLCGLLVQAKAELVRFLGSRALGRDHVHGSLAVAVTYTL